MPAHSLAATEEAGPEDVLRPPARDRIEQPLEIARVVLAVAVQVDGGGVPTFARGLEAAAQRRPDPPRAVVGAHLGAGGPGDLRRAVLRAVVDDEHVERHAARFSGQPGEHAADRSLLVARHHDRQAAASLAGPVDRALAPRQKRAAAGG